VARQAGVSPESIYKGFGTKAALVKEVFDVAVAGDDEPVAVADRPQAQRVREESDVRVKLRLYAEDAAVRAERSARVQLALRNGAASDPAIGGLWQELQAERLAGMTMLARHLVDTGQLRAGTGVDEVRDVLWTCISVEVYDLLVHQRGWTRSRYAAWLARTLIASLTET
jgi:AcrR family transcriptional regulator